MNSAKWNEFSEFLRFSQMAQESSPELHDALLYAMKYGESSGPSTVEMRYVKQMLANDSLNEWQSTISALSAENPIEQRAPWIWRGLQGSGLKSSTNARRVQFLVPNQIFVQLRIDLTQDVSQSTNEETLGEDDPGIDVAVLEEVGPEDCQRSQQLL